MVLRQYRELSLLYCNYVTRKYEQACIVFDGYQKVNTKYMTHMRRSKGKQGAEVRFRDEMKCSQNKDDFLSNPNNKQRFISLLGEYPENRRCVVHVQGDADLLIATTAIRYADTKAVGDDTDLIVLMCYYVDLHSHNLFLHTQSKSSTHKSRFGNTKKCVKACCSSMQSVDVMLHQDYLVLGKAQHNRNV